MIPSKSLQELADKNRPDQSENGFFMFGRFKMPSKNLLVMGTTDNSSHTPTVAVYHVIGGV